MNEGETIPCYECQKELETIYENGTLWVEPCPRCIEVAVESEKQKRLGISRVQKERTEQINGTLESIRRDYAERKEVA